MVFALMAGAPRAEDVIRDCITPNREPAIRRDNVERKTQRKCLVLDLSASKHRRGIAPIADIPPLPSKHKEAPVSKDVAADELTIANTQSATITTPDAIHLPDDKSASFSALSGLPSSTNQGTGAYATAGTYPSQEAVGLPPVARSSPFVAETPSLGGMLFLLGGVLAVVSIVARLLFGLSHAGRT